jgi:hypothetical protein
MLFIVAFAVVYWRSTAFVPDAGKRQRSNRPLLLFSLLFSVDTFLPLINLTDVRSWGWRIRDGLHWVELCERIVGVLLSAAVAYSVTSYLL